MAVQSFEIGSPRTKRTVSVCIPAYNEADCIAELGRRLQAVFAHHEDGYDFEAIICENGSSDDTYDRLLQLQCSDARFKIVRLSRNFYAEGGVTAALAHARGECAIIMNADLQDPPEYISDFLLKWEEGYDNVYAIVAKRTGESLFRRTLAYAYYWVINRLSDSVVPRNVSDFRLVDRRVYETYLQMPERYRIMRYMWPWIGFPSIGISTERPARKSGNSKFSFFATLHGALLHILVQSRAALTLLPIFGIAITGFALTLLLTEVVRALAFGVPFNGFGTIMTVMLGLFGLLFLFLWVVAEYVGMIFQEVRERPTFIVARTHGLAGRQPIGGGGISVVNDRWSVDQAHVFS